MPPGTQLRAVWNLTTSVTCMKSQSPRLTQTFTQVYRVRASRGPRHRGTPPPPPGRPPGLRWLEPPLHSVTRTHPGHQVPAPVVALRAPPTSQPRALPNCPREAWCAGHGDQTGPGVTSAREAGTEAGSGGKCERRAVGIGATPSPVALRLLMSVCSGARGTRTLPATCAPELIS